MKSKDQKVAELQDTFQLGVDWSKLDDEDLREVYRAVNDPQQRMRVVKRVARQLDSRELTSILRAAAEEKGGPVVNVFL